MPLDLQGTGNERTRWIALDGHLSGVEILVRGTGPQEGRRFHNRLLRAGIVRPNRDNPLDIADGREAAFFEAMAEQYVLDWRGAITPEGTPYSTKAMGAVLGAYRKAFDALMQAVAEEDAFFVNGNGRPMTS